MRNVDTGEDLEDLVEWVKFSGVNWANDNSGFYYSRYDKPEEGKKLANVNKFHKLYFHRLGTSQDDDKLIYERKDQEKWGFGGYETRDGNYLVIDVWEGTSPKNGLFFKDLKNGGEVVELRNQFEAG